MIVLNALKLLNSEPINKKKLRIKMTKQTKRKTVDVPIEVSIFPSALFTFRLVG
jgi:hypothetical protein